VENSNQPLDSPSSVRVDEIRQEEIETLAYQAHSAANSRPCGAHSCDREYPALPSRWCNGCLIKHLLATVQEQEQQIRILKLALDEECSRLKAAEHRVQEQQQEITALIKQGSEWEGLALERYQQLTVLQSSLKELIGKWQKEADKGTAIGNGALATGLPHTAVMASGIVETEMIRTTGSDAEEVHTRRLHVEGRAR
jgi:DNA repair exonuclease SbcCD ATPase subunit